MAAAELASDRSTAVTVDEGEITAAIDAAVAPFARDEGENPYTIHHDLQETMQDLVGIIRTGAELEQALNQLEELEDRAGRVALSGGRRYNPGWNLTTDLPAMLTVSRCTTLGALNRRESRGGHTRDDYPKPVEEMGTVNFVERIPGNGKETGGVGGTPSIRSITVGPEPIPAMPDDLKELLEEAT
jgi:succinate dehydrogenase / fumarate reductase flavoprotein subunit